MNPCTSDWRPLPCWQGGRWVCRDGGYSGWAGEQRCMCVCWGGAASFHVHSSPPPISGRSLPAPDDGCFDGFRGGRRKRSAPLSPIPAAEHGEAHAPSTQCRVAPVWCALPCLSLGAHDVRPRVGGASSIRQRRLLVSQAGSVLLRPAAAAGGGALRARNVTGVRATAARASSPLHHRGGAWKGRGAATSSSLSGSGKTPLSFPPSFPPLPSMHRSWEPLMSLAITLPSV